MEEVDSAIRRKTEEDSNGGKGEEGVAGYMIENGGLMVVAGEGKSGLKNGERI